MRSKGGKRNESGQAKANSEGLHVKLDRRIIDALRRESEARGGRQEHQITEEALAVYLSLRASSQNKGFAALSEMAVRAGNIYKYTRIVE